MERHNSRGLRRKIKIGVFILLLLLLITGTKTGRVAPDTQNGGVKRKEGRILTRKAFDYDLPVNEEERLESEEDFRDIRDRIKEQYEAEDKGNSLNVILSEDTVRRMMEALKAAGYIVSANAFPLDMCNYERMEEFLNNSREGKEAELVTCELYPSGGIGRVKFEFDGREMHVLYSNSSWNRENELVVAPITRAKIKAWEYTKKGWFIYEVSVPEPPAVSEIINGIKMVRVKPLDEEYRELASKYLAPIGYQGNNLFRSNWDAEHMGGIDYNGLYQYLYFIKYGQPFDGGQYEEGIPEESFESLMTEYLPVTEEELRQYGDYDSQTQTYGWIELGSRYYTLTAVGSSIPEIADIKENDNGTKTLTVNGVCEALGDEAAISHELTVRLYEDGKIRYLENRVLGDELEKLPGYQYRMGEE